MRKEHTQSKSYTGFILNQNTFCKVLLQIKIEYKQLTISVVAIKKKSNRINVSLVLKAHLKFSYESWMLPTRIFNISLS